LDKKQDFYEDVYAVVANIPEGRVTTYGAIARYLGAVRSSRLVGWVMNNAHSLPTPIPAHRVVNRNGFLTGKMHFATPTTMEEKLRAEGLVIDNDQILHFNEVLWDPSIEMEKLL
jgi:methylated-DNA-protein-cysteine methyltransferase-like protein